MNTTIGLAIIFLLDTISVHFGNKMYRQIGNLVKHYYKYDLHEPTEKWKRNMTGPTECHQMMVRVVCNVGLFHCKFFWILLADLILYCYMYES
jgi:cytochrome b involved in lipid metabolism